MSQKIGIKLSMGFVIMVVLIFVLGGSSFISLNSSKSKLEEINDSTKRLVLALKIRNEYEKNISDMRGLLSYKDERFYDQVEKNMRNALAMQNELLKIARPEQRENVQEIIDLTNSFVNTLTDQLLPVLKLYLIETQIGNNELAEAYFSQIQQINADLAPVEERVFQTINSFIEADEKNVAGDLQSAERNANSIIKLSLTISAIAIIIGIFLSVFLTRIISKPILEMVRSANSFAAGDFSAPVKVETKDEIGTLARALNKMQENFIEVIQKLNQSSGQLTDAARHLAEQARYTSSGASETAAAMNEIAVSADKMTNNINDVSSRAMLASEHAGRGAQGIGLLNGQMEEISATSLQAGADVESLGVSINKIVQFVEVINNIAEQTNLLALNAAIEAARAGDSGRGFAVVAEEIRKLAEQSAQSAGEIRLLIDEIEGQSKLAVRAMRDGGEKIKQGGNIIHDVGENFSQIIDTVQELSGQVQKITASAQHVFAAVQNTAGTAEEQTAAMEEVHAASEKLNNLAGDLNQLVLNFKV